MQVGWIERTRGHHECDQELPNRYYHASTLQAKSVPGRWHAEHHQFLDTADSERVAIQSI